MVNKEPKTLLERCESLGLGNGNLSVWVDRIEAQQAEIERLKAEISQRITVDEMNAEIDSASKAVAEHYEKQLSAERRDAERYRFIRNIKVTEDVKRDIAYGGVCLDQAVDASMAPSAP